MKRFASTFAVIASLALLSACGLTPEEKFAEAENSFAANDFSGAKVYLVSALKDKPGAPELLALLAKTQIAMGDAAGALNTLAQLSSGSIPDNEFVLLKAEAELIDGNFETALSTIGKPSSPEAARIVALAQLGQQDIEAAKATIQAGLEMPGDTSGLLAAFAQIQLSEGDADGALDSSRRALKLDPTSLDALIASAKAHQALANLPQTLAVYEKAAKLYPQNFAAEFGRVATLAEMGRYDEADKGIGRLSELAPKSIDVIHLRARLALERGEYQAAREILQGHEAALRADPSMQVTYGTALLRVGQAGLARVWLEPVVEAFPNRREVRTLLAEAELGAGDPARALATIRPLAERPDARPEELEVAARAAAKSGDISAERFAKRSTLATPEWIGGELAKGDTALRNQQWAKAIASYEAINARSTSPNAMVLNNLAYAKARLGLTEEAVRIALQAVEIAPDHPSILDTAGWLLVETGKDRARGINLLEKASKLDPDNKSIARNLAAAKRS